MKKTRPDAYSVGRVSVLPGWERGLIEGAAPNPPVEEWAEASETINYEVVTRISSRVIRIYSGGTWIEREIDVLHSLDEALKDIDTSVPESAQ